MKIPKLPPVLLSFQGSGVYISPSMRVDEGKLTEYGLKKTVLCRQIEQILKWLQQQNTPYQEGYATFGKFHYKVRSHWSDSEPFIRVTVNNGVIEIEIGSSVLQHLIDEYQTLI